MRPPKHTRGKGKRHGRGERGKNERWEHNRACTAGHLCAWRKKDKRRKKGGARRGSLWRATGKKVKRTHLRGLRGKGKKRKRKKYTTMKIHQKGVSDYRGGKEKREVVLQARGGGRKRTVCERNNGDGERGFITYANFGCPFPLYPVVLEIFKPKF